MHAAAESIALFRSSGHGARALIVLLSTLAVLFVGKGAGAGPPNDTGRDETHVSLWHAYRGDEERALREVVREI